MIFDSIALKNFGVYGGEQGPISLAPADARHPIVLFGGMNGGGKTTLLDAIQLVLYGPRARCAGRGKLGYREYLRAMINRQADPQQGAAIDLRFRRAIDGEMKYFRIVRSWRVTARDVEETVAAYQDLQPDPQLSEHWDEYIEGYIPSGIAHLFFFDAEQIKELADGEHAAEILGTAIHTLLGMDLVDRLETDLIVLERRKRAESRSGEELKRLREASEELERMNGLVAQATLERDAAQQEIISVSTRQERLEYRFRQEGGELFLSRSELEAERKRVKSEQERVEEELRELAAGAAPLLLVPGLLEETERQVRRENEVRKSHVLAQALNDRDEEVLLLLKRKKVPSQYLELVEAVLGEDRQQRKAGAEQQCWIYGDEQLSAELRHLQTSTLPEVKAGMVAKLNRIADLQEKVTHFDVELARVPREDAIAGLLQELKELRRVRGEKEALLAALEEKLRVLTRQRDEADRAHKKELGSGVEEQVSREHIGRVLKHSGKVRETLGRFRSAIIRKHAERLERLVLESFTHLLRKTNLVSGLRIDPATFTVELTGGDGKPLPFDRLSAGERQLLATSLLWGLAKASGRPLPTIIDTPLGRLDSSHRRHLLDRYFPVASHQVILLSTDEEVNKTNLKRLKPFIGHSYYLHHNETSRSTQIQPGYFAHFETAS